jgi:hypothetical protein
MNQSFKLNDNKGEVRSVSIVFYSENKGFLICDEMRKAFPPGSGDDILQNHLIGGKCELNDKSPIETGFREFVEETEIGDLSSFIKEFKKCKSLKWDFCVSEKKQLWNRFYIINIDSCPNQDFIYELYLLIEYWNHNDLPLKSIYWWKPSDELSNPSSLLKSFIKNIPNSELLL